MKVGFLTPSVSRALGGIYEIERHLAKSLVRDTPAQVEVVGLEDEYTEQDLPEWRPLEPTVLPVRGPTNLGYAPQLRAALDGWDVDLLHLHVLWRYTSYASLRWHRETGRPHLVTINGMLDPWAVNNARWKKRIAGWLYEHANLQEAACLQVNTEKEYRAVRDYGLETPVAIVPNGVQLPNENPPSSPPWADHIPADANVLLFLGRIHPKKGLQELLEAWAQVHQHHEDADDWVLVIIGWDDGGHQPGLEAYVNRAGLEDSVFFLGPKFGVEKEAAFHHADAFILPSYSEGLPMAVLEAWSYRLPVLKTAGCNLPEGFEEDAALQVAPEPDAIREGLSTLFAYTPEQREVMGQRGRVLLERRFTWSSVAEQMYDVYRWICNEAGPPSCIRFK
jgi:poly(glycerol-phosphate) alpha-glucosyltransferase